MAVEGREWQLSYTKTDDGQTVLIAVEGREWQLSYTRRPGID